MLLALGGLHSLQHDAHCNELIPNAHERAVRVAAGPACNS